MKATLAAIADGASVGAGDKLNVQGVFDTIFAEGQRRYIECLSAYARQFLEQMEKPEVESVEGISPSISIDQKTISTNPRSTVGTITEVYDLFRLLFARVGTPHCPSCGRVVSSQTPEEILKRITEQAPGAKLRILAPVIKGRKGEYQRLFERLHALRGMQNAFADFCTNGREVHRLLDVLTEYLITITRSCPASLETGISVRLA